VEVIPVNLFQYLESTWIDSGGDGLLSETTYYNNP